MSGSRAKLLRLREVREAYFLTQGDLAVRAGVTRSTIIDLEKGRTEAQFRTVRKLADVLGVNPGQLVESAPTREQDDTKPVPAPPYRGPATQTSRRPRRPTKH